MDTKETMTRMILIEAFIVLFLEIVCTTFLIKILQLFLCTVALHCSCVAMLLNCGVEECWGVHGRQYGRRCSPVGQECLTGLQCPVQSQSQVWWCCSMLLVGLSSQWTEKRSSREAVLLGCKWGSFCCPPELLCCASEFEFHIRTIKIKAKAGLYLAEQIKKQAELFHLKFQPDQSV